MSRRPRRLPKIEGGCLSGQEVGDHVPGGVGVSALQKILKGLEVVAAGEEWGLLHTPTSGLGMTNVGQKGVAEAFPVPGVLLSASLRQKRPDGFRWTSIAEFSVGLPERHPEVSEVADPLPAFIGLRAGQAGFDVHRFEGKARG